MGDAACQRPDGFQTLGLLKLGFQSAFLRLGLFPGRDVFCDINRSDDLPGFIQKRCRRHFKRSLDLLTAYGNQG